MKKGVTQFAGSARLGGCLTLYLTKQFRCTQRELLIKKITIAAIFNKEIKGE